MTEKEIFEGIHNECGKLEICNYNETGCGDCLIKQTLIKAEKALEKQIPKEAHIDNEDFETYHCPSCGVTVGEHQNYCWKCGQRFEVRW